MEQTLTQLRTEAAKRKINVDGKNRFDLIQAITAYDQKQHEQEMRLECARRGLSTEGKLVDLELRLIATSDGSVSQKDRQTYYAVAVLTLLLGVVGLALSIPHIASALENLMGTPKWVAFLLAGIIDGGIVGCKVIDTLSHKFRLTKTVRACVWVLLGACLIFSGLLNSYEFLQTAVSPSARILAVTTAFFLVTFVFLMFMIGSSMIVKCEDRVDEREELELQENHAISMAENLSRVLKEFDDLKRVASRVKV